MQGGYLVTGVIGSLTFLVYPPWKWKQEVGEAVRPAGFYPPEHGVEARMVKEKLTKLILDKEVELGLVHGIEKNALFCDVYFKGKNLAEYFRDYKR